MKDDHMISWPPLPANARIVKAETSNLATSQTPPHSGQTRINRRLTTTKVIKSIIDIVNKKTISLSIINWLLLHPTKWKCNQMLNHAKASFYGKFVSLKKLLQISKLLKTGKHWTKSGKTENLWVNIAMIRKRWTFKSNKTNID